MKVVRNFTIDLEVYLELQSRKANVSALVNDFLRSYCDIPDKTDEESEEEVRQQIIKTEVILSQLKKDKEKKEKKRIKTEEKQELSRYMAEPTDPYIAAHAKLQRQRDEKTNQRNTTPK